MNNNYGGYGYGYYGNDTQDIRRRMEEMQRPRYQQQPQYQPTIISGCVVTSVEEARAAQIPLDGTKVYFPSVDEKQIYMKYVGLDGAPVFITYEIKEQPVMQHQPQQQAPLIYASQKDVMELKDRIEQLEDLLTKGAKKNVQPNGDNFKTTK